LKIYYRISFVRQFQVTYIL